MKRRDFIKGGVALATLPITGLAWSKPEDGTANLGTYEDPLVVDYQNVRKWLREIHKAVKVEKHVSLIIPDSFAEVYEEAIAKGYAPTCPKEMLNWIVFYQLPDNSLKVTSEGPNYCLFGPTGADAKHCCISWVRFQPSRIL